MSKETTSEECELSDALDLAQKMREADARLKQSLEAYKSENKQIVAVAASIANTARQSRTNMPAVRPPSADTTARLRAVSG